MGAIEQLYFPTRQCISVSACCIIEARLFVSMLPIVEAKDPLIETMKITSE